MSGSAQRRMQLVRLERLAALQAETARRQLAAAVASEREVARALDALEVRRQRALARAGSGPEETAVLGAWLRWASEERRRLTIDQAARRAHAETLRAEGAEVIARHAVIERLRARSGGPPPGKRRV